jgi:hypothetical protein
MENFLMGAIAMGSWIAMLFFLRFWYDTGDRLFAMFAAAFLLLGITRLGLCAILDRSLLAHEPIEGQTYWYWARLAAFLLILIAVIDKNRR